MHPLELGSRLSAHARGLVPAVKQKLRAQSLRAARDVYRDEQILLYWCRSSNWGDALSPVLTEWLSGKKPVHPGTVFNLGGRPVYGVVGSVLHRVRQGPFEVWGSGFISAADTFGARPRKIHAVRGPLTRERALAQGVPCPAVYGDPALLFPRLYSPPAGAAEFELGIIAHYVEQDHPMVRRLCEDPRVHFIDICGGLTEVVDEVRRCRSIASSSLHGVILADAYGIPSTWIQFTDQVVGGGFKFRDYFTSVGRRVEEPLTVGDETTVQRILDRMDPYRIDIDLDALVAACPFYSTDILDRGL